MKSLTTFNGHAYGFYEKTLSRIDSSNNWQGVFTADIDIVDVALVYSQQIAGHDDTEQFKSKKIGDAFIEGLSSYSEYI